MGLFDRSSSTTYLTEQNIQQTDARAYGFSEIGGLAAEAYRTSRRANEGILAATKKAIDSNDASQRAAFGFASDASSDASATSKAAFGYAEASSKAAFGYA